MPAQWNSYLREHLKLTVSRRTLRCEGATRLSRLVVFNRYFEAADHVRFPPASLLQANSTPWYEEYFQAYTQCKTWEGMIAADLTACDYYCTSQVKVMGENCTSLGEECGPLDCAPVSGEGYKAFLDRMIAELKAQMGVLDLARYNESHRCNDIMGTAERCFKNCDGHVEEIVPKTQSDIPGCCAPRTQGEDAKCKELTSQREAWEAYDQCYDTSIPQWETTKAEQVAEGQARMAQMRSLQRMLCYVDSFGPDQKSKFSICMEKDFTKDEEVLAMELEPGVPEGKLEAFACNASETPGTKEFDALHYGHLPAGLAGCPTVQCQTACGYSSVSSASSTNTSASSSVVEKTTVSSKCFKKASLATAVYWDLGSSQDVGKVSAMPQPGIASIKVYLTDVGPNDGILSSSSLCGSITAESTTVECSSKGAARYLALAPFVDGTCVFGACTTSWCSMEVDGTAMSQEPVSSTGESHMGQVVVNATAVA
ncbi:unnamed protein product [Effrenium voratum]|nr:unnamed protein product [Effrenium voratum]